MTHVTRQQFELAETLAEETRRAIAKRDLDSALLQVTSLAIEAGLADLAGVTERVGKGRFETASATDPLVTTADHLQYELDQGPCVDASYHDGTLSSPDVGVDERWPKWGPQASRLGIKSVLSVHLYTDHAGMGALNLYSTTHRTYTEEELAIANLVGTHASVTLAHFRGEAHLWKAIDTRHQIGVAQGILRHQYNITAEQALALLNRISQTRNIKLRELATEVINANNGSSLQG